MVWLARFAETAASASVVPLTFVHQKLPTWVRLYSRQRPSVPIASSITMSEL